MLEPQLVVAAFHFLRPAWLLLIPIAAALSWLYHQRRDPAQRYAELVAPHLLAHLVVGNEKSGRFSPVIMFVWLAALAIAVAGPTWSREASPFADDQAALVIVIDASDSMTSADVAPSRLERAKQKARDLLALREGAKTGLVAYAGSAHIVLPLTSDRGILELYLGSIDPKIMPRSGKHPASALEVASGLLARSETPGSIVFVTDGIPAADVPAFTAHRNRRGAPVLLLQVSPDATSDVPGADVTALTVDDRDVRRIDDRVERDLAAVQSADGQTQWRDSGYFLLIPLVLLAGFWFRRGFAVRWMTVLLLGAAVCWGEPAHADDSRLTNLFWTQDQQARRHFERGEYVSAAEHFRNPMWKGVAYYAAGRFEQAAAWFAKLDTAAAWFNRGNAYAHLERYEDAAHAYRQALEREPGADDATVNLALVEQILERIEEAEPAEGGSLLRADEYVVDDEKNKQKRPEGEETTIGGTLDERLAELWMRQVQTTPAAFLKTKFAIQLAGRKDDEEDDG